MTEARQGWPPRLGSSRYRFWLPNLGRPGAAPVEQPEIDHRAEQRAAIAAGQALFQALDRADEHGQRAALAGDEGELGQSILAAAQGEPADELLDGGVARPYGEENEISLFAADAGIGHEVAAFVDAVQEVVGGRCRHGDVLDEWGAAPPAGRCCPLGWKENAQPGSNCRVCGLK